MRQARAGTLPPEGWSGRACGMVSGQPPRAIRIMAPSSPHCTDRSCSGCFPHPPGIESRRPDGRARRHSRRRIVANLNDEVLEPWVRILARQGFPEQMAGWPLALVLASASVSQPIVSRVRGPRSGLPQEDTAHDVVGANPGRFLPLVLRPRYPSALLHPGDSRQTESMKFGVPRRRPCFAALTLIVGFCMPVGAAETDPMSVGPAVGSQAPAFEATDHLGQSRNFESLTGESGLLLLFFRSADW